MSFKESQKFSPLIYLLIAPFVLLIVYGLFKQIYLGEPFGDKPASDTSLVLILILLIGVLLLFWAMQLQTTITEKSIQIRFVPFVNKTILWKDVKSAEVLQYGFVGGWGIRLGTKYGTVYNISGNKGLAMELKSGKKILVGTQKEEELKKVIRQLDN